MKRRIPIILLFCILVLGFMLRYHNYAVWPREGATFDEYAWTWLGMNIIQKGVPISWSPHPQYKIRTHYIQNGARFWLVQPYLEHPPLFGLVAGSYALVRGQTDMYHLKMSVVRELALLMGVISIGLVYLLGIRLYGASTGLLAALFYAVTPTVVIGSRLVQNENFYIPVFLVILLITEQYIRTKARHLLIISSVLCGLLMLAKVPWVAAAFAVILILLYKRRVKDSIIHVGIVGAIFSLFILYGLLLDREVFLGLWKLQLARYDMAFDSIFALFTQPYLVDRYYLDGWIFLGWLAIPAFISDVKKHYIVVFAWLSYFLVFLAAIPNEPGHGWYRYPFYPFLAIALSYMIKHYFNKNMLITFLFLVIVGVSMLEHTWAPVFGFSHMVLRIYILLCGIGLLSLQKISKVSNVFLLILVIFLSSFAILGYFE